jgi:hypothetical protein
LIRDLESEVMPDNVVSIRPDPMAATNAELLLALKAFCKACEPPEIMEGTG